MASAAPVTMFIAPGPMDAVTARVARRRECLAKPIAAWTRACSLRPWMNGIVSRLVKRLPEAGDVAVTEDAQGGGDQPAAFAVGDGVLPGQVGHDRLGDGQSDGGGSGHGRELFPQVNQDGEGNSGAGQWRKPTRWVRGLPGWRFGAAERSDLLCPSDYQGRPCRMTVLTSVISATAERGPSLPMPLPFSPPYGIRSARHSGVQLMWTVPGVDLPDRPHRTGDVAR